jgi:hypothetical protein
MTYRRTVDAYAAAEEGDTFAADALPLSEWAEARRDLMTPQTIAANHALHVESAAHALRKALAWSDDPSEEGGGIVLGGLAVADAALALLAAIGEDTES